LTGRGAADTGSPDISLQEADDMNCAITTIARMVRPLVTLAGAFATAVAAQPVPAQRNLSTHPPHVLHVKARLLPKPVAAGNSLIEVAVAQDEVLPPGFALHLENSTVVLRDDGLAGDARAGDRVYSSFAPLDVAALKRNQDRLRKLRDQVGKLAMPVYRGRQRVARVPLPDEFFEPLVPGAVVPIDRWGFAEPVVPDNSLVIRHPSVVEDPGRTFDHCSGTGTPMAKWTFGFLMEQMANFPYTGIDPAEFVRQWIELSQTTQAVNGWSVEPFNTMGDKVLAAWPRRADGTLDLARAPFKLLAIVNRVDLRDNLVYGGSSAGEARFVFGFRPCAGLPDALTVIFEYGIDRSGCIPLKTWAQQWQALGALALGSPEYNAALEAITDQFALAGAAPGKTNRSALNQLRTNGGSAEFAWEFREFRLPGLGAGARHLKLMPVRQTPDRRILDSAHPVPEALAAYVNEDTPAILADDHVVPLAYRGFPFLGGASTRAGLFGSWNSPRIANREARHKFALQTCNACHLLETRSVFFHVHPTDPRAVGMAATLSGFMTGIDVPDPFDGAPTRHFNEFERRAVDLDGLANGVCVAFTDPTDRFDRGALRGPIPLRIPH
jgi:hypothetical protein